MTMLNLGRFTCGAGNLVRLPGLKPQAVPGRAIVPSVVEPGTVEPVVKPVAEVEGNVKGSGDESDGTNVYQEENRAIFGQRMEQRRVPEMRAAMGGGGCQSLMRFTQVCSIPSSYGTPYLNPP